MSESARNPPSGKVFIGGLSWETTGEKLRAYFENYGVVREAFVSYNRNNGRPRGFGFVVFESPEVAEKVVATKHTIDRREVEAKKAVPKDESQGGGEGQGSGASSDAQGGRSRKIFVGGLAPAVDERLMRQHFGQFGEVEDAVVMYDHDNKRPRGFGFVTFATDEAVEAVFAAGTIQTIADKQIEIKSAVPRDQMPAPSHRGPMGPHGMHHGGGRGGAWMYGHGMYGQYGGMHAQLGGMPRGGGYGGPHARVPVAGRGHGGRSGGGGGSGAMLSGGGSGMAVYGAAGLYGAGGYGGTGGGGDAAPGVMPVQLSGNGSGTGAMFGGSGAASAAAPSLAYNLAQSLQQSTLNGMQAAEAGTSAASGKLSATGDIDLKALALASGFGGFARAGDAGAAAAAAAAGTSGFQDGGSSTGGGFGGSGSAGSGGAAGVGAAGASDAGPAGAGGAPAGEYRDVSAAAAAANLSAAGLPSDYYQDGSAFASGTPGPGWS